jgi:hypothetical protein
VIASGDAPGLEHAKAVDLLAEIELSPSEFGIHFPRLDADFYVPRLLKGFWDRGNGWGLGWAKLVGSHAAGPRRQRRGRMG